MTNLETRPAEQVCEAGAQRAAVELIEPRDVPLGGPRAMTVRRTLPSKERSLIGAFCFLDHYGPDDISASGGMDVAPHPHTGLQTVTWLFQGHVLHQDALGTVQPVHPGQLNLMTAGRGISHSEEGTLARFPEQRVLHGVQLWTALPDSDRKGPPAFEHVPDPPVLDVDGARVQVFMGELLGARSTARAFTPLLAAQVDIPAGATVRIPVDRTFEHGVLTDEGELAVEGRPVDPAWLAYLSPGRDELVLEAGDDGPVRAVLIGGEPFPEQILMWWNFVGRTHEEVVEARDEWQQVIGALEGRPAADPAAVAATHPGAAGSVDRFGTVPGYDGAALPAPELPPVRLKPRRQPGHPE